MTIGPDEIIDMNSALERCEGYITLGMLDEAREELRSVPKELRTTFPYMATCMNLCLHFHWWDEGAELGRNLVLRWPGNHEVRAATVHCMLKAGRELDGILLMRGIDAGAPHDAEEEDDQGDRDLPDSDMDWRHRR
ncbi:hypothetical protein DES53_102965 [Roseimicrobium gellanilyticum]|uniref:Tetratricopeptide repeat protein n=1 Tax=Roseimicrobium gellanilyticum TaxID=748857 RepID=A0A366HUJ2_9BACT|nr:hypothetical protein [Roseimicrobium gellanilyticum]RBP46574.1 hypothetical protein DES53_102965 [Roseimicrobium gellanilyticum]